jgi:SAM-dependent methyltransferase
LALHYFDKKRTEGLFGEIYDVLKPGGIFATLTNTIEDPETKNGKLLEPEYYEFETIKKRFMSVDSMKEFTNKFETIILDNHGETHKDEIKTLIRFVGNKN